MLQTRLTFFVIISSLFFVSCAHQKAPSIVSTPLQPESSLPSLSTTQVSIRNAQGEVVEVFVELAQTDQEREQGLMHRTALGERQGMLFLFPNTEIQSFWMKNTIIPLDMIFIDENKKIITIAEAVPCIADPCKIYGSGKPVKYVLEVNKGFTALHQIQLGSEVLF